MSKSKTFYVVEDASMGYPRYLDGFTEIKTPVWVADLQKIDPEEYFDTALSHAATTGGVVQPVRYNGKAKLVKLERPKHPAMTDYEKRVFIRFAKFYKINIGCHSRQLEGDKQLPVVAAGNRLIKKGVLCKPSSCNWYLTDLGKEMAVAWQKAQKLP